MDKLSHWVKSLNYILTQHLGFPYLNQIWVKTTQRFSVVLFVACFIHLLQFSIFIHLLQFFFVFTVVSTQIWVKYGQTLNVGLKMREKKIYSEVISWVKILNYILFLRQNVSLCNVMHSCIMWLLPSVIQ